MANAAESAGDDVGGGKSCDEKEKDSVGCKTTGADSRPKSDKSPVVVVVEERTWLDSQPGEWMSGVGAFRDGDDGTPLQIRRHLRHPANTDTAPDHEDPAWVGESIHSSAGGKDDEVLDGDGDEDEGRGVAGGIADRTKPLDAAEMNPGRLFALETFREVAESGVEEENDGRDDVERGQSSEGEGGVVAELPACRQHVGQSAVQQHTHQRRRATHHSQQQQLRPRLRFAHARSLPPALAHAQLPRDTQLSSTPSKCLKEASHKSFSFTTTCHASPPSYSSRVSS